MSATPPPPPATNAPAATSTAPVTGVGALDAIRLTFSAMLSQAISRGRLAMMGLLTALSIGVSLLVTLSAPAGEASGADAAAGIVVLLGYYIIVPVVSLVLATSTLGASHHDGTLVYLWLRPMKRWPVALGGWLATMAVALPFNLIAVVGAALIMRGGGEMIAVTALTTALASGAYAGLFGFFSLLVRNAVAWGLAYILVWEAVVSSFGVVPARMSIRGYTTSIIGQFLDDPSEYAVHPSSTVLSVSVLVAMAAGSIAASTAVLRRADIR